MIFTYVLHNFANLSAKESKFFITSGRKTLDHLWASDSHSTVGQPLLSLNSGESRMTRDTINKTLLV